ncbi:MAG: hypothetical protein RLN63_03765, partial [Miltoncostaeaceae bacterium]
DAPPPPPTGDADEAKGRNWKKIALWVVGVLVAFVVAVAIFGAEDESDTAAAPPATTAEQVEETATNEPEVESAPTTATPTPAQERAERQREARERRRAEQQAAREQAAERRREAQQRAREQARLRGTLVEGSGSRVITAEIGSDGPVVVEASHRGGSNFVVEFVGNGLDELLVNEIGTYSGTSVVPEAFSGRYRIAIDADGPWSVRYRQPEPQGDEPTLLRAFSGEGPQVLQVRSTEDLDPIIAARGSGGSNFIVELVAYGGAVTGRELLFNEIGPFQGETLTSVPAGDYLLNLDAEGPWTVRFSR